MTPHALALEVSPGLAQIEGPTLVFAAIAAAAVLFALLTGMWD